MRDIEWVIFDEIHYINDPERGVVWEEVIIMLPNSCSMVCLSATVPNHFECAAWIGRTKQRAVHVVSTPKRPTPLRHHVYAADSLWRVVDDEGRFEGETFRAAQLAHREYELSGGNNGRGGGGGWPCA